MGGRQACPGRRSRRAATARAAGETGTETGTSREEQPDTRKSCRTEWRRRHESMQCSVTPPTFSSLRWASTSAAQDRSRSRGAPAQPANVRTSRPITHFKLLELRRNDSIRARAIQDYAASFLRHERLYLQVADFLRPWSVKRIDATNNFCASHGFGQRMRPKPACPFRLGLSVATRSIVIY